MISFFENLSFQFSGYLIQIKTLVKNFFTFSHPLILIFNSYIGFIVHISDIHSETIIWRDNFLFSTMSFAPWTNVSFFGVKIHLSKSRSSLIVFNNLSHGLYGPLSLSILAIDPLKWNRKENGRMCDLKGELNRERKTCICYFSENETIFGQPLE